MDRYFELLKYSNDENYKAFETERGTLELFETTDFIDVYLGSVHLGEIFHNPGDWDQILGGENPIETGWEDGCHNSLSYDGWGPVNIDDVAGQNWKDLNNNQKCSLLYGYMDQESKTEYEDGVITITVYMSDGEERIFKLRGEETDNEYDRYVIDDNDYVEEFFEEA